MIEEILIEKFKEKFGNKEVELPEQILVIEDNLPSPFSSGSNGYIEKLRIKNNKLEYYLNWWSYGWYSDCEEYSCQINYATLYYKTILKWKQKKLKRN